MVPAAPPSLVGVSPSEKGKELENSPVDFSSFHLLHDVFRHRASDPIQKPLLAFPKAPHGAADFEYFTGKDLDRFTDKAAWYYARAELATTESRNAALLGPTNLDWVVSVFGLSRAGFTILTISPRLSYQAMAKLIEETECKSLIYIPSAQLLPVVDQVKAATTVRTIATISRSEYDRVESSCPMFVREVDVMEEKKRCAAIMHSSGSTGLPKPIYITHARYTTPHEIGPGDRDFVTLPLFHSFAFQVSPARMYQRKTVFFLNSNLPVTCEGLTSGIREAKPGTLCAVPYVLKLLSEQENGIEALKSCEQVMFTGSQCPDDLGDCLVERGVNLATFMGSTECGYIGASIGRPREDKAWNYIRVPPPLMKHIWPKPINKAAFEFVYLKEYTTRIVTNSDDPPDSFHSKDIFTPHASIPGAWKYLGRLDDRVTLINGEKVLPLPIEGRIRQAALVKEAVVFGIERSIPGLLLFRAEAAKTLSDEAFISSVWPEVEVTNHLAEGFSQIGRDMIVPMPAGIEIPTTDKGSVIRAQVYKMFEREIDMSYALLENRSEGTMKLDIPDLEKYLMKLGREVVGPQLSDLHDDLFTLGMNSLQAIQIRGSIVRDLDLGGNGKKLSQNIVFEQGNLGNLAKHLDNVRLSHDFVREKPITIIRDLISKFSVVGKSRPSASDAPRKHVIVLTGATGGLGAHLLVQILEQHNVEKVYCLVRGKRPSSRLQEALESRHLIISNQAKLSVLMSDLSRPKLGLEDSTYSTLLSELTHIIHCAWPVNFQLTLSAFEPSIQGLQNLLQSSLDVSSSSPARFLFCSSISTALGTPSPARILEAPVKDLQQVSVTGYAQSKLVSERIVQAAVEEAGADATILRIGQVVGDTKWGVWNDSEALPLIIRSAMTMGVLPQLDMACSWLPVDTVAASVLQIAGLDTGSVSSTNRLHETGSRLVYNIVSPHTFSWTSDLLPALSSAGLSFRPVSPETWMHQLRQFSFTQSGSGDSDIKINEAAADPTLNPAIKLVDFFEESFLADGEEGEGGTGVVFETEMAEKMASALREAPLVLKSGLLGKMVGIWLEKWKVRV